MADNERVDARKTDHQSIPRPQCIGTVVLILKASSCLRVLRRSLEIRGDVGCSEVWAIGRYTRPTALMLCLQAILEAAWIALVALQFACPAISMI